MPGSSRIARLFSQWFLIGLAISFLGGYRWSTGLAGVANAKFWQHAVVAAVMFLTALPIEFAVVRRAFRRPLAPLLASGINVGLAPLLVWPLVWLLEPELGAGFAVLAATPCTLASAAVWTRRAGGNDVVAILVTLLTNLTSCWVLPAWLALLTSRATSAQNLASIAGLLFWIVVVPIVAAQIVRRVPTVRQLAIRRQPLLSVLCQIGILSIVLVGAVKMAEQLGAENHRGVSLTSWVWCGSLALSLHLVLFAVGLGTARGLRLPRADRLAVGFSGSQKTLMVGLSVAIELGFSIIPLVMYHVLQLIVDTLLADYQLKSNRIAIKSDSVEP